MATHLPSGLPGGLPGGQTGQTGQTGTEEHKRRIEQMERNAIALALRIARHKLRARPYGRTYVSIGYSLGLAFDRAIRPHASNRTFDQTSRIVRKIENAACHAEISQHLRADAHRRPEPKPVHQTLHDYADAIGENIENLEVARIGGPAASRRVQGPITLLRDMAKEICDARGHDWEEDWGEKTCRCCRCERL